MTLKEIAQGYKDAAVPLRNRLRELRQVLKSTEDPEEIFRLKRRIAELTPMLTECNALADICEHYYEPGYYRDKSYCYSGCVTKKKPTKLGSEDDSSELFRRKGKLYSN